MVLNSCTNFLYSILLEYTESKGQVFILHILRMCNSIFLMLLQKLETNTNVIKASAVLRYEISFFKKNKTTPNHSHRSATVEKEKKMENGKVHYIKLSIS